MATKSPSPTQWRLGYRILDSDIELRGLPATLIDLMNEALGHLDSAPIGRTGIVCTLIDTAHGYVLSEGERVVDRCADLEAVVPMVKAALIRIAIERATAFAIVHAAAVYCDGQAIVLPGPAGSGKSTLAASLVLDGWVLAADDITILDRDRSFTVRPLPTALCLKTESWPVIAALAPEVEQLAVHRRADGQSVRYFIPQYGGAPSRAAPSVPVGLIAFPRYKAGASLTVRRLDRVEAFDRILPQFYPTSNRFDGETIDRLISLLRQVPTIELCYGDGAEAVDAVRTWAK